MFIIKINDIIEFVGSSLMKSLMLLQQLFSLTALLIKFQQMGHNYEMFGFGNTEPNGPKLKAEYT